MITDNSAMFETDTIALIVAIAAIITAIYSTIAASIRDEAHNQISVIQEILKELSTLAADHLNSTTTATPLSPQCQTLELMSSLKIDLIESSFSLLMRRCRRYFLFDANATAFTEKFTRDIADLRTSFSSLAYEQCTATDIYRINAKLNSAYAALNGYIGERFRPVFEIRG